MQQKRESFRTTFQNKRYYLRFFFKFSAKIVLCSLRHIFNKVNKGTVQKPDEVGT